MIVPSKFFIQTEQGEFEEVVIVEPKQIITQINQNAYDNLIAAELNLDIREIFKLKAENIRDTKLVGVFTRENDVVKAKQILHSLFNHLKKDLDKKVEVEIKGLDTQIESKERGETITAEMKEVKDRINRIEEEQRKMLKKESDKNALAILLYSNEIQNNFRYYNTLDEKLTNERITHENINLAIEEKKEAIKLIDNHIEQIKTQIDDAGSEINNIETQIEDIHTQIDDINAQINDINNEISKINNQIDTINNKIENVKNEISLLQERKARIDYAQLIKEPTSSISPVSPKKKLNIFFAGIFGLIAFSIITYWIDSFQKFISKSKFSQ